MCPEWKRQETAIVVGVKLRNQVGRYLDGRDLEKCRRVTVAFRHIACPLLFSHVILWSSTWEAKCSFLLGATSEGLLSHIKKVTIRIDGIPGLTKNEDFQPLIQSFLRTVGPQLDAFCIHPEIDLHWKRDICDMILPHIHTFELLKIDEEEFAQSSARHRISPLIPGGSKGPLQSFEIRLNLIEATLLDAKQKAWVNGYHRECLGKLSPLLKDDERALKWLEKECQQI
ncbi:hypothetical protein DL96DRAFT_1676695 [Flagelloscypha sp. PMI_526]|nr:hypothetical protein DL96DRAFT_1676695 [Flagelloscypha sp. PMI_526]